MAGSTVANGRSTPICSAWDGHVEVSLPLTWEAEGIVAVDRAAQASTIGHLPAGELGEFGREGAIILRLLAESSIACPADGGGVLDLFGLVVIFGESLLGDPFDGGQDPGDEIGVQVLDLDRS